MSLGDDLTYYDILDLPTHANPHEIREGYNRAKAAFQKDNLALYSIMTTDDREETLKKIEEAYQILSSADSRRKYDQLFGIVQPFVDPNLDRPNRNNKIAPSPITSIDRVPPMENIKDVEMLLIPPVTDIPQARRTMPNTPAPLPPPAPAAHMPAANSVGPLTRNVLGYREARIPIPLIDPTLRQAIDVETEWHGSFLKKVRESYRISIEEMAGITKVTKTYLLALEEENFQKLPAAVYIRGFITQVAKVLKLPHDKVAIAYLTRYYQTHRKI